MNFKRLAIEIGVITVIICLLLWLAHKRGIGVIPPNTDATISIENGTVTVEKNNERTMKYAPKGTKIIVNKDGSLRVISKQYGLTREFGIGIAAENPTIMPVFDVKLAYYMRLGLNVGTGVRLDKKITLGSIRPYAAIRMPFRLTLYRTPAYSSDIA